MTTTTDPTTWTDARLDAAARTLAWVARQYAPPYVADDVVALHPQTGDSLAGLTCLWRATVQEGKPYPVNAGWCDATIYADPDDNLVARVWHDAAHIQARADFTFAGEVRTFALQATQVGQRVTAHNFGGLSDAVAVLEADIVGQAMYYQLHGAFPTNQRAFVLRCLRGGLSLACIEVT